MLSGLTLLSQPPTRKKSAASRRRMRSASPSARRLAASLSVIELFGPWALCMIEMWQAGMLGRYLSIHRGWMTPSPFSPHLTRSIVAGRQFTLAAAASVNSGNSLAISPAPNSMPNRVGSSLLLSTLPWSMAAWAAATASWIGRAIIRRFLRWFFSTYPLASKSDTSAAIRLAMWVVSIPRMGRTALLPLIRLFQNESTSRPSGVTNPSPVMTTRLGDTMFRLPTGGSPAQIRLPWSALCWRLGVLARFNPRMSEPGGPSWPIR